MNCSNFANQRTVLFDDLQNIDINYGPMNSSTLSRMLLFGNPQFFGNVNSGTIDAVIKFNESTNSFSADLFMINITPNIFISVLCSQIILSLFDLDFFFPGLCSWRYHRWCLAGTQPLVWSVYCFLFCTFYLAIKKKRCRHIKFCWWYHYIYFWRKIR